MKHNRVIEQRKSLPDNIIGTIRAIKQVTDEQNSNKKKNENWRKHGKQVFHEKLS